VKPATSRQIPEKIYFSAFLFCFLFSVLCPLFSKTAQAQKAQPAAPISEYDFSGMETMISLDIRQMDVVHFLKFLASEGNLNIVASKNVAGPVNLLINDVTIGDALEIVLSLNNLAYEVRGNIIKITSNEEYKAIYGVDFYDQRETAVYRLKYASATNVGAMLGNVKSEIGKVIYDDSTGTLVLIDTPEKIEEMKVIIERQELPTVSRILPTETEIFELKYAEIDDIKAEVSEALTADIGTIRTDARTKTIVVTDLPHKIAEIRVMIEAFDRKTREVFIEAKIVEVTLTDTLQWGIDWDRIWQIRYPSGPTPYTIMPEVTLPLSLTSFGKITVDTVSTNELDIVLEVLDTITDTRIISNPHLTVQEGKEAAIGVIEKQPYEEETTTTASGGTTTSSKTYQWVDVGVSLSVTPLINEDGYINLVLKPEVSSISTWYGGAAQASGAVPVVKSAKAETTVTVKDGVTIIIAGLIKDNKTVTVNKIPLLGDLPLVGAAFRSVSDDVRRTETIVFLTPRIITGDEFFLLQRDMPKPMRGVRE